MSVPARADAVSVAGRPRPGHGGAMNLGSNFAEAVVGGAPPERIAVVERAESGHRSKRSFGEVHRDSGRLAGVLRAKGVGRGDVVVTVIGSRYEWVLAMVACFRIGAVVLPCPEQLRAPDLRARFAAVAPALVVADPRNREGIVDAGPPCDVLWIDDPELLAAEPPPAVALAPEDPALMTFTSGTTGGPKAVVHGQRYLWGQALQARSWLGAEVGEVVWCTAAPGWSKAARNVFLAPWLSGATALLHDARFDPDERLELLAQERVSALCMSPTEYRILARRTSLAGAGSLRTAVAAGEALDAEVVGAWQEAAGVQVRDGYGQTETGQLTGIAPEDAPRPGSMGRALPGVRAWVEDGELVVDPATVPTFFLRYLEQPPPEPGRWRTGDCVEQDGDGYFWFRGRNDDIIVSSGYRIGPEEVEAVLLAHDSVAEAAAVPAPDVERGAVVRAVVVPAAGVAPSDELAVELKAFAKQRTAPYKYPRIIEFAETLPRTTSGKLRRGAVRDGMFDQTKRPS